jgi:selenocysteine lyase/cysteine desulfurase
MAVSSVQHQNRSVDWEHVRASYPVQRPLMNLNNASVSPPPLAVEQAVLEAYRLVSANPDVNMWNVLDARLPQIKAQLAVLADCSPDEVALNRNATEGLSTAIFGIPLSAGDHVLISAWDYPSACAGWIERQRRDRIEVGQVDFAVLDSDDAIVAAYADAILPTTRVIHLTHMLHWTGRVMPVERICALARDKGILTLVDGAQSFAQIPLSFRVIGCDYFVTSLHKWLGAPVGNGMLIVDRRHIAATSPLLARFDAETETIDKFDHWNLGTYNSALQAGIEPAVRFHAEIGVTHIHARLRELTRYWIAGASDIAGFRMHTPIEPDSLGAVSLFSIDGVDSKWIEQALRETCQIHGKYRKVGELEGIRISPHIYMSEAELDRLVDALRGIVHRR